MRTTIGTMFLMAVAVETWMVLVDKLRICRVPGTCFVVAGHGGTVTTVLILLVPMQRIRLKTVGHFITVISRVHSRQRGMEQVSKLGGMVWGKMPTHLPRYPCMLSEIILLSKTVIKVYMRTII